LERDVDVAVKILSRAGEDDSERFEREAQVLASLNHPNIAAIYGVEQGAIVMELVEGSNPAGPLPADTLIAYARQIAAGLEAAHEKGIVHRDLKPANIKVTPDGVVKLLDFGLAKAREESSPAVTGASPTMSPTLSLAMTHPGMILGTAAYMSPEQASGKPVDRRADIWAFGVIVYELLTGRHPYGLGETVTDTLAAIVSKDVDLDALAKDTPPRLRRLIEHCLRKDPRMRLRDIGDARLMLDEPDAEALPAAPPAPARRRWVPWAVAAAGLAIAALAAGIVWMRPGAADPGPGTVRFTIPLPQGTTWPRAESATEWAPSPDGRNLAMVVQDGGGTALWVRPIGAPSAHRLDTTEGANYPFWSPDGQSIAFFAEDSLRRIPVSGGAPVKICDLPAANSSISGDGGAWNKEGVIVFAAGSRPLMRVAAAGGISAPATTLGKDETAHHWPQFLPDGRHVLYEVQGTEDVAGIYVQELGSAKRVRVLKSTMRAVWSPPGYLLFPREGNLFAQRMNPETFQLEGEPISLAEDVRTNDGNGRSTFAVSGNGMLVYRTGGAADERQIGWWDREGKVLNQIGKPVRATSFQLSPDQKSAALIVADGTGADVWVMDLASGVTAPATHDGKVASLSVTVVWSPDSKRLAVALASGGVEEITVASGQTTLLTKEPVLAEDWSPDGRSILCNDVPGTRFVVLSLAEGHPLQTVVTTPYIETLARLSPDGKYVAYGSFETGNIEVYVASFPSFAVKRRVSNSGGTNPVWAKGGKEIFYRAGDGMMTEAEIRTAPDLEVGGRRPLFKYGPVGSLGDRFGVTPDGQRFLIAEPLSQRGPEALELTMVADWPAL
ncbi:MAG TPA: protein kinase, partial [Candidatus Sulfopaludibacter sp.]|nr:protein kinase [Candidatus Sulfopaludibacter sp.]